MYQRGKGAAHACYGAWIWPEGERTWTHLASYKVLRPKDDLFDGFHSFVEDFRRDSYSPYDLRRARFGPAWSWSKTNGWAPASSAIFTASANRTEWSGIMEGGEVDAGAEQESGTAYLATGGPEPGAGEKKLHQKPLTTLAPGDGGPPARLPADPNTVFTTTCPVSPPKTRRS